MKKSLFINRAAHYGLLMMKYSALVYITVCCLSSFSQANTSFGQKVLDNTLTIELDDASFPEALDKIALKAAVRFAYTDYIIQSSSPVTLQVRNERLGSVLERILTPRNLTFTVIDNTIVLKKKASPSREFGTAPTRIRPRFRLLKSTIPLSLQQLTIKGKVTDKTGPLPGVSVMVKGTMRGTSTDQEGNYALENISGDETLVFSFLGYKTQEIPANSENILNVIMELDVTGLDEVVVVGYGTQKRKDITGAISSINAKELSEVPVTQVSQALQGRAAGVQVTSAGNKPGAGATIRIRGNRSFSAGNDPLYVIDGMPISGGLDDINPQDIESIEILKDASATAIYGSRGANGVIIVSTRRGQRGGTVVSYDMYAGMSRALGKVDMMNGQEYAEYKRESRRAVGSYDDSDPEADQKLFEEVELESIEQGRWTDYQELLLQQGFSQNHQLSVSGGGENTLFNLSFNYFGDDGIIPGQDFTRYTTRINIDHHIGQHVKIGTSTLGSHTIRNGGDLNPFPHALRLNPLSVPYDENGNLLFLTTEDTFSFNPLSEVEPGAYVNEGKAFRLFSSIYGEAHLARGLKFRLNFGPDLIQSRQGDFQGSVTSARREGVPTAQGQEEFIFNYTLENILTYNRDFNGKHFLDITGLYSIQNSETESSGISVRGIPVDAMQYFNFGAAEEIESTRSAFAKWSIISYMARLNYNYDNKFLLTLTGRIDGSSKFGTNNKYGFFPSIAAGWTISNEKFMEDIRLFDLLKLRLSYGEIGNSGISPYQKQGLLSRTAYAFGDDAAFGYGPSSIANDDLRWETTASFNAGVDFSLGKGRFSGTFEFYQQNTRDLLMERQLPFTSGFTSILENIGSTRNTGFEATLSGGLIQQKDVNGFNWSVSLNLFTNKEEIIELYGGKQDDVGNGWFIGHPINVHFDYEKTGIWQLNEAGLAESYRQDVGQIKVRDQNGDGQITADDRVILGTPRPKLSGGMTHRFEYKGFELSIFAFANFGNMIYSTFHQTNNTLFGRYNNIRVDYWTPSNPTNAYPQPNMNQERPLYASTMAYFNGSFVKIRNINLSYNFPSAWAAKIGAQSLRLYVSAQQPFIFSPYVQREKGIDPELVTNSTPAYRTFLLGLNVKF